MLPRASRGNEANGANGVNNDEPQQASTSASVTGVANVSALPQTNYANSSLAQEIEAGLQASGVSSMRLAMFESDIVAAAAPSLPVLSLNDVDSVLDPAPPAIRRPRNAPISYPFPLQADKKLILGSCTLVNHYNVKRNQGISMTCQITPSIQPHSLPSNYIMSSAAHQYDASKPLVNRFCVTLRGVRALLFDQQGNKLLEIENTPTATPVSIPFMKKNQALPRAVFMIPEAERPRLGDFSQLRIELHYAYNDDENAEGKKGFTYIARNWQ